MSDEANKPNPQDEPLQEASGADDGPVEAGSHEAGSQGDEAAVAGSQESAPSDEQIAAASPVDEDAVEEDEDDDGSLEDVEPLELIDETEVDGADAPREWYIVKVQSNRESSISDALRRRVKMAGLESYFGDIIVPTEDVVEFKAGKKKIVKRKLYPGYILVHCALNDDTWFLVRETTGIGDFTGSAGKPTPMLDHEVERILNLVKPPEEGEKQYKTAIPFKPSDRVRIKDGTFENFEGDVDVIDEANGRVTVMISIFGRSTPVELEHWQIEAV